MLPILYSFRRCPYAMRARLALTYSGIQYEHREILLKDKPQSMLDFSNKGTVPVLVVGNRVIDESLEIMQWALNQSDPDNWLQVERQFELIEQCDNQFKPQLDRYKYSDRYDLPEVAYRNQALWFLELLADKLGKHQYLVSNLISMADMAILPFIRQYSMVHRKWFEESQRKNLQDWLNGLLVSNLFEKVMQKHELWRDD